MTRTAPDSYTYVYASLERTGLGNMLFPWARALAISDATGATLLPARWRKLRLGPWLRREPDKRQYQKLFRRPSASGVVARSGALLRATLWDEQGQRIRGGSRTNVLVVKGMDDFFDPLVAVRLLIRQTLFDKARPGVLTQPEHERYVAMHVRLGDFARPRPPATAPSRNLSTPLEWFEAAATRIASVGTLGSIVVCSDGTDDELRPLLALPGVSRSTSTNALNDLRVLSRASLIVGSSSTFSAWGAFLGDVPLYVAPGANHYLQGNPRVFEVDDWSQTDTLSTG